MSRFLATIPLLACFLGACGSQSPTIRVLSAQLAERTDQGAVIQFVIEADNPNEDALPLQDVTYSVDLDGKTVFSGTRSAESTIRRFGRQQVRLPAAFAVPQGTSLPPVAHYRISGDVVYVVPGAIAETLFDQEVIRPSASFSGEGTVELVLPAGR